VKQAYLLFNPASGSFTPARAELVRSLLREAGVGHRALFPASADEAAATIRQISRTTDEPLIIAVGGDGTVNTVLNAIANPGTVLGYIPLGTANVLARELKITSPADAVARIKSGNARPFTAGRISGRSQDHYFLLMAGIGFDGAVVADVRPSEKHALGKGAYLLAAWRQLRRWDNSPLLVKTAAESRACHTAIVCNAAHYGGSFLLAPGASIFSPTFTVVGVAGCRRKDFTLWAMKVILSRSAGGGQGAWSWQADRLEITGAKSVQADGDRAGRSPVTIAAVPAFARLLV
jgi:diacylglycerol kinase family enzyme